MTTAHANVAALYKGIMQRQQQQQQHAHASRACKGSSPCNGHSTCKGSRNGETTYKIQASCICNVTASMPLLYIYTAGISKPECEQPHSAVLQPVHNPHRQLQHPSAVPASSSRSNIPSIDCLATCCCVSQQASRSPCHFEQKFHIIRHCTAIQL